MLPCLNVDTAMGTQSVGFFLPAPVVPFRSPARRTRAHQALTEPLTRRHHHAISFVPRMNQSRQPESTDVQPAETSAEQQSGDDKSPSDDVPETTESEQVQAVQHDELVAAAPSPEPRKSRPQYSQRARLREETEAPFRKARMFVYGGSALSASVGGFIASLRVIAALSGVSGVQPLNETLPNLAVDLAVIAACVLLLRFETKAGERRLERMSRGARIASLRVQDAVTRQVLSLKDMRGRRRVVLVAGPKKKVTEAMNSAEEVKDGISKSELLIVPFITDNHREGELRNWRMQPFIRDDWLRWFTAERDVVKARLRSDASDVLVVVVRLDGKVGARSVGPPLWPRLVAEISKLPTRDQYGKP